MSAVGEFRRSRSGSVLASIDSMTRLWGHGGVDAEKVRLAMPRSLDALGSMLSDWESSEFDRLVEGLDERLRDAEERSDPGVEVLRSFREVAKRHGSTRSARR